MKYWNINQLQCVAKDGDFTNFVVLVDWMRIAKETINDKDYFANLNGSESFSKDDITDFIPYEDLTYDIVCDWLNASLNVEALDTDLDAQIENQVNPPIVVLPLPFQNPE